MANTVTVACKHPSGLVLRLFDMVDSDELVMGGGSKTVKRAVLSDSAPVVINGYAKKWDEPYPTDAKGKAILIAHGYALTPNVDADFWNKWVKDNADHDMVRGRLIYALAQPDAVQAKAKEQSALRSGLEPLAPDDRKDARVPRGIQRMGTEARA